jgi:hypothetical protein
MAYHNAEISNPIIPRLENGHDSIRERHWSIRRQAKKNHAAACWQAMPDY